MPKGKGKGKGKDTTSAFLAFRNIREPQPLPANAFTKVIYPSEQYDFNNEYDTATGNFIPKKSGIYTLIASIDFLPDPQSADLNTLELLIRVNGNSVALNFELIRGEGIVTVSAVQQLQTGDTVDVLARSFISGNINGITVGNIPTGGPDQTRFEGALIRQID